MVAYKVGSADEDLDHTGLAHYLEHLMFKGTDKIMPGDIDRRTAQNGGQNNAFTSEDYTIYYFDLPARNWEFALQIEADRMRNLRIDTRHEFEQEKGAVIEELHRNEDEPWDLEFKSIVPVLFDHGPYGHPVIGERDHVKGATAEVIKGYYDRWYHPNNAALIVCGGFDPEHVMKRIKELFGPIPEAKLPERRTVPDFKRSGPVRKEIPSKFESARLLLGFNTVKIGDPDFYPLDVIQELLASGKLGRLYKKLVEGEELARDVSVSNGAGRYPGWFAIQVGMLQGKDRARAEKVVFQELKELRDKPVDESELKRVKRSLLAAAIFGRESVHGLAESIGRGVMTNDLDFLKNYLARVQAVTAQDVQEAARKYFLPDESVLVWSVPQKAPGGKGERATGTREGARRRSYRTEANAGSEPFSLEKTQRVELPNGLTLLLLENHRLPIFVAHASLRWVNLLEPDDKLGVAALTGRLLDEGTTQHTGRQIAEMIESTGGALSMSSSGGSVKVLSPDHSLGVGLLFECLSQANFPPDAFGRQQAHLLTSLADAERQPEVKADRAYKALAYGKHPLGRPSSGTLETVLKLTRDDCETFYKKIFAPNNTVLAVVGDFDSKQVIDEITRLTAGWKKEPLNKPETPPVEKPKEFVERIISMPEAAQVQFYMGHAGIRRDNPDYYKLLVMDHVLGTGPGFTDRLSARLRDREGLAYTVSAQITHTAGLEPGLFTCYIGTRPDALARAKQVFLEEIERLQNEKPTAEEVEDAKKYLLGSLAFQFTTNDRVAGRLLMIDRFHLGLHYYDDYRKAVGAVTPEDVREVAKKYLDPKHMVLVAAGAVDAHGRPLVKLPPPKK
jgi:zinc protease